MQLTDKDGNIFGTGGLEITTSSGKPKVPVINTDITIGTTAIVGGVAGRLLFDDAGVVGETNGVHWDKLNSRMGFGTVTPAYGISHIGNIGVAAIFSQRDFGFGAYSQITQRASYIAYTTDGTTGLAIGAASGAARIQGFNGLPATSDKPIFLQSLGGNVGIGTTTDAGYKLDVNGTARIANSLRLAAETTPSASAFVNAPLVSYVTSVGWAAGKRPGISFWGDAYSGAFLYFDGSLTFKAINDAGLSMTFASTAYVLANQPWAISGSNISYTAGNVGIGTSTLGTTTQLTIGGAQTASSAIARGILLNTSLTQSIANDVLTAVQITPTLSVNNTLFHEAYWLRLTGSYTPASYTSNNNATTIDLSNSFTNTFNAIGIRIRHTYSNVQYGYGILLESVGQIGIAQTSSISNNFFAGTTVIGNSVIAPASGYSLHVTNNTNGAIKIGNVSDVSEHLIISHSQAGATFSSIRNTYVNTGAQMQISVGGQDNLRLFGTGNITVGGTTDAGYKLDVNGNTRIQGNTTLTGTLTMGNGSFSYSANPNNWFTISGNQGLILNQANGNNGSIVLGASNSANFTVALTNTTMYGVSISRPVTPIAGSTNLTYNSLEIDNVINYTNATNSIVRGLYIHPTLTSVTDFRAIETTVGNVLFGTTSGNVGIGTTSPANILDVRQSIGSDGTNIYSGFVSRIQNTKDYDNVNGVLLLVNQNGGTAGHYIRAINAQGSGQIRFGVDGGGNVSSIGSGSFSGNVRATQIRWNTDGDGWIGDGGLDGTFMVITNSTERYRVTPNGNLLINTTTDAGYKLDVAGSIRVQNTLSISNPSFTSGGSITHSANATLVITGGPGGGTENITFGPTNRIFINATQSRFPNGSVQIASTLSVGVANATSQNMIWATGGITASSAIARGIYTDTTLTASANNDFLVGLDVQPTFTNGAFTGVTNLALRTTGQVRLNANGEISSFQGYGSDIFRVHSNANGLLEIGQNLVTPIGVNAKATIYNRNNTYSAISINVPASQLGKGAQIAWNNQGQGGGTIYHSNEVLYDMGMVNANSHYLHMFASGNVLLTNGTRTDAGFKLDVNGSARVQSGLTVSGSLNLNSSDISSAWTAYTPAWTSNGTQPSLGNGSLTGAYKIVGKTCFVRVRLALGTTSTGGTGHWLFSLPVAAIDPDTIQFACSMLDNGLAWYQGTVNGTYAGHTDKTAIIALSGGGANSSEAVTAIRPFTWGSTDSLQFNGSYEIA